MKRTYIVATIGPVSDSEEQIEQLIRSGVNIFRFNMKHADHTWHDERIARVRKVSQSISIPVGILIDLQGPEIRIETPNKESIVCQKDEVLTFGLHPTGQRDITIPTPEVFTAVKKGDTILIDDGAVALTIIETETEQFRARISTNYIIKHRKSINLPGVNIPLPSLIEDDYEKLNMTNMNHVDFVALSFTRTKEDIQILRNELKKRGLLAWICAKIENQMALDHIQEIVTQADCIMVARGDLAVETPMEQLAYNQKRIIKECQAQDKPVITATQMLHSMVHNPRPTRAEMCDVSNAVYDGTDAVMLSEETAAGDYPVETVQTMAKIVRFTETVIDAPTQAQGFAKLLR